MFVLYLFIRTVSVNDKNFTRNSKVGARVLMYCNASSRHAAFGF